MFMSEGKLNEKQTMFCKEYLIDLNATQAAIRAGYNLDNPPDGYYVYFLINPITNKIFYIGKGKGNRIKQHSRLTCKGNAVKNSKIKLIQGRGNKVSEVIFECELTESRAFEVERNLISKFKFTGITNIHGGTVTEDQNTFYKIEDLRNRIKPLHLWERELDSTKRKSLIKLYGTVELFYDKFVSVFDELFYLYKDKLNG